MENKKVSFDGKNLFFNVDGVQIINGEMPTSFEIKEEYIIDKESLAKLVAVLSEGTIVLKEEARLSLRGFKSLNNTEFIVYCGNSGESKMLELAEELYKENKILSEECQDHLEVKDILRAEIDFLNSLIGQHNESNFLARMREIRKEGKV